MHAAYIDYLDALTLLRPVVHSIQPLVDCVDILDCVPVDNIYAAAYSGNPASLSVVLNAQPTWPRIERIELALHVACVCYYRIERGWAQPWLTGSANGFTALCDKVGCVAKPILSPRERWRVIGFTRHYSTLPVSIYEDRESCTICDGFVATGSQAPDALGPCHIECFRYAHCILAPALRESRSHAIANAHDTTT